MVLDHVDIGIGAMDGKHKNISRNGVMLTLPQEIALADSKWTAVRSFKELSSKELFSEISSVHKVQ